MMELRKAASHADTIAIYRRSIGPEKPCHLAWMRRQDGRDASVLQALQIQRKIIQSIGIDHPGNCQVPQQPAKIVSGGAADANARSKEKDGTVRQQPSPLIV